MRYAAPLLALSLLGAVPLLAQMPAAAPGAKDISRVTGGTYHADHHHTLVGWRVNHLGFNDYFGIFGDATGTLTIDPKNPAAAKLAVPIPVASLTVATAGPRDNLFRPVAVGAKPAFFVAAPPPARFASPPISLRADGTGAKETGN